MDLPAVLRESLAEIHQRIERLPYAVAIIQAKIDRDAYLASLWQFLEVHEALEAALSRHPELPCHDPEKMSRSDALRRDLAFWGSEERPAVLPETSRLANLFDQWSETSPYALLGALYVFEGSRMGSMYLVRSLSKALGVPPIDGQGLDYHAEGIATRPRDWNTFRDSLRTVEVDSSQGQEILSGTRETFDALYDLYAALSVVDEDSALVSLELAS